VAGIVKVAVARSASAVLNGTASPPPLEPMKLDGPTNTRAAAACDGAVPLWCPGDAELAEVDAVGRAVAVGQAAADGEWLVVLVDFDELQAAAVIVTAIRPRMSGP
jgi:hypothetical protein